MAEKKFKIKVSTPELLATILRNEVYDPYAAMTKDEAQRRYWTFYEAVKGNS